MDSITQDPQLEALVAQATERERRVRRRVTLWAWVPVVLALALLAFTGWQVAQSVRELQQTETSLAGVEKELKTTTAELDGANAELSSLRQEVGVARADLDTLRKELDTTRLDLERQTRAAEEARKHASELQGEVDRLNGQLDELISQLKTAQQFEAFEFEGSMAATMKSLAYRNPELFELLRRVSALQGTPWSLEGSSPEEGFDSPTFAAYVLMEAGWLPQDALPATFRGLQARLGMQPLPAGLGEGGANLPLGAVIFYPEGYTLFSFLDEQNRPFVMGMTPLGVLALQPDFAEPLGYAPVVR